MINLKPKTIKVLSLLAVLVLLVPNFSHANAITAGIANGLYTIVAAFFGWLVWASGLLLNYAVSEYVVGFGKSFTEDGIGLAVNSLWTVIRDVFNLTFIFGLVFIGFKMILNSDSGAKKMLVNIILAALLVNFSLFITKFVIDFSNIAATQIAESFTRDAGTNPIPSGTPLGATNTYMISDAFANQMGLGSVWQIFGPGVETKVDGFSANFAYIFGSLILFLVTAFVFTAGAFLLIIRFVVLNIYMILSPIMFLGWVFPNFSGVSSQYWNGFLKRAFVAPAYLLMLYISKHVLQVMNNSIKDYKTMGVAFNGNVQDATDSFTSTFPIFIVTSVFLVASIIVAQKMGAEGANNVMAIGNRIRNKAQGALKSTANVATYPIRYGAGYVPRTLTNRAGKWAGDKLNDVQSGNGLASKVAKWNWVDNSVNTVAGAAKKAQYGTGSTDESEKEYKRKTNARANQTKAENERKEKLAQSTEAINNPNTQTQDLIKALNELGKTVRDMSKEEKDKLGYEKLKDKNIAQHLTDSDIEHLEKTGNYSAQQIKDIKDARKEAYKDIATTGSVLPSNHQHKNDAGVIDSQRAALFAGKSVNDIGKLPTEIFTTSGMYKHITPTMLEAKMKQSNPDDIQRAAMRVALSQYLKINPNDVPDAHTLGSNNSWVKWVNSNSVLAAQFFSS